MVENCNFKLGDGDKYEISLEETRKSRTEALDEDTTCGVWIFRGPFLQRFANKQAYVILFGLLGCLYAASSAYFSGTISTVEKRFGIPSRMTGIITVGNDLSSLMVSTFLTYYASKKHQPRWIGFGMYTIVLFCILSALPHFIFGPGNDAIQLTEESGQLNNLNITGFVQKEALCDDSEKNCRTTSGNMWAPIILFIAQFVSGLGGALYHTLGVSYMDDNLQRSQTPMMLSFIYFIRSLGPVIGFFLSSIALKIYIAPSLTPIINNKDPRWLGAWWMGWIIFAVLIFIFSTLVTMFPKKLPETKERIDKEAAAQGKDPASDKQSPASFDDMKKTFKRLFTNGLLMCNNLAAIFYVLGMMPFFIFAPKYIEVMFAQTAAFANLISGTLGLACGAIGILLSGVVLSKYKPKARALAAWNVFCGMTMALGVLIFTFLECSSTLGEKSFHGMAQNESISCNAGCNCDYVKYSPVCSADKLTNYISPCHAGCKAALDNKVYYNCSCVHNTPSTEWKNDLNETFTQAVTSGRCPVDCKLAFGLFLLVICILQLVGATGKTSNFLVAVRCVDDKDKPLAMGIGLTMISIFAFIPSPILFGYLMDQSCYVWGKTCTGKSNCWLYNSKTLRYSFNYTSAAFISVGVLFDIGVWYLAKNIQIFDEEIKTDGKKSTQQKTEAIKSSVVDK